MPEPITLTTSFALLRRAGACKPGYHALALALGGVEVYGDDTAIPLDVVAEKGRGVQDGLWCLQAVTPGQEATRDRFARLIACRFAFAVLPIFERSVPGDDRPRNAIRVARRFALDKATEEELAAAWAAAGDAASTAAGAAAGAAAWAAAWDAAWAAAWAAVGDAAWAAARAAAWAAAGDAAWAAARAAARAAAGAAAWAAAWDAAWAAQKSLFIDALRGEVALDDFAGLDESFVLIDAETA